MPPSGLLPRFGAEEPEMMTTSKILLAAAAAIALSSAAAAPAFAVAISHTNRAGGEPGAVTTPTNRGTPPTDTTGPSRFDKLHGDSAAP